MKTNTLHAFRKGGCLFSLVKLAVLIVVLVGVFIYFSYSFIASLAVKHGAAAMGIEAGLGSISIRPSDQTVEVYDLYVKNPEGFSDNNAFAVKKLLLSTNIGLSLLTDKVIDIKSVEIVQMELTLDFKVGADGGIIAMFKVPENNLSALVAKLDSAQKKESAEVAASKTPAKAEEEVEPVKLIVRNFVFESCVVNGTLNGKGVKFTLPSFTLKDLGVKEGGLTPTQLSFAVINDLTVRVIPAFMKQLASGAVDVGTDAASSGTKAVEGAASEAVKSIKSIF